MKIQKKLYRGSLAGLTSPVENHVPMVIADITIKPGVTTVLDITANFHTFLYALNGSVVIIEDESGLNKYQVGWLDITTYCREIKENEAANREFLVATVELQLIQKYYIPSIKEVGNFVDATDILNYIIHPNPQ